MGMTLYSCITPIAQMSRNIAVCVLKLVVADCYLASINIATGVSLRLPDGRYFTGLAGILLLI